MSCIFVTGIDTDIGKTVATAAMARYLKSKGMNVMTQKMVQTGCENFSEDIQYHRNLMGINPVAEDRNGLSCPYLFKQAASPHLAAAMEGKTIDPEQIRNATRKMAEKYNPLLIEGAGGLFVPLNKEMYLIDYIQDQGDPVVLVSSSRLGSINHTLLSIEALFQRKIKLLGIVYNCFPQADTDIQLDSKKIFQAFLKRSDNTTLPPLPIIDIGYIDPNKQYQQPPLDFGALFDTIRF